MISMRADAAHGMKSRTLGVHAPDGSNIRAGFRGTEDWIYQAIGTDRDVLLIGPDAIRFAGGLTRRRCRILVAGCGDRHTLALGALAIAGTLDDPDGLSKIGDRRFDVVLATELMDDVSKATILIDRFRDLLHPGGYVVATQSEPSGQSSNEPDRNPSARGTLFSLFEAAGFAIAHYQPMSSPERELATTGAEPEAGPKAPAYWFDRTLFVSIPTENQSDGWLDTRHRLLAAERDAALRQAADATREWKAALAESEIWRARLNESLGREKELRSQLGLANQQIEHVEKELHTIVLRISENLGRCADQRDALEARLQVVSNHRDELESRIIRLRRSLPGRLFHALQAFVSIWRR